MRSAFAGKEQDVLPGKIQAAKSISSVALNVIPGRYCDGAVWDPHFC